MTKTMPKTPQQLNSPKPTDQGKQSNTCLGKGLFFVQTILNIGDVKAEICMAIIELQMN